MKAGFSSEIVPVLAAVPEKLTTVVEQPVEAARPAAAGGVSW